MRQPVLLTITALLASLLLTFAFLLSGEKDALFFLGSTLLLWAGNLLLLRDPSSRQGVERHTDSPREVVFPYRRSALLGKTLIGAGIVAMGAWCLVGGVRIIISPDGGTAFGLVTAMLGLVVVAGFGPRLGTVALLLSRGNGRAKQH